MGAGKQIPLAPHGDGPDGVFNEVVVNLDVAVIGIAAELFPALLRIVDRPALPLSQRKSVNLPLQPARHT